MPSRSRSSFRSSSARSLRRKTSWQIGPSTGASGEPVTIIASSSVLAAKGASIAVDGITTVRWRGELNLLLSLADAAGSGFHGAFGIGVATTAAFLGGVATLPTPLDEEDWDGWVYHRYFSLLSGGPLATATAADQQSQVNSMSAAVRIEVDSKAMRKEMSDMTEFAIIQVVEIGASSMEFAFNSRTLIKLP